MFACNQAKLLHFCECPSSFSPTPHQLLLLNRLFSYSFFSAISLLFHVLRVPERVYASADFNGCVLMLLQMNKQWREKNKWFEDSMWSTWVVIGWRCWMGVDKRIWTKVWDNRYMNGTRCIVSGHYLPLGYQSALKPCWIVFRLLHLSYGATTFILLNELIPGLRVDCGFPSFPLIPQYFICILKGSSSLEK